ncbi:effector-associated constant component EACC1 [Streptomyces sp. NPDC004014]
MNVAISVQADSADEGERELRSLCDWMLADAVSRRHARPALTSVAPSVPGAQGGLVEMLNLVLGTGFNAASLALSIASWRRSRPQQTALIVERADGMRVTLTGGTDEDARLLLAELERGQG